MAWIARGKSNEGYVQDSPDGETACIPALATHHGEIWCLWSDPSADLYYAIGNNDVFQPRVRFPDQGIPVLAELYGVLHALIVRSSGEIAHYIFDDDNQKWPLPTLLDREAGLWTDVTPALKSFHNRLVTVYVQEESLYYSIWTITPNGTSTWSSPQEVSGISKVQGIPALFVLNGTLHVLCGSKDDGREMLGFAYTSPDDVWNSCDDVSEGKAARGFSATSYGDSAFLAFQENGPDDSSHVIYMAQFKDGQWHPREAIADQASTDPPQLAVLNGRINCIFNAHNEKKDLMWYSRPLLDFSLSSWMSKFPDETSLSNISIPGTHDSCARANIPFVRTQYLSITKQMDAGIRFLDLRLRVHSDGDLYCYHGGVPMNFPWYLKFSTVMKEVFDFFTSVTPTPTETVLVSINNDDISGKEPPSLFYNAVQSQIEQQKHWITSPTTSTLGSARGKAVLLRRYHADPALSPSQLIGIDLSGWLNNNPDFTLITPTGVSTTLQDKWEYIDPIPLASLISSKYSYVSAMLDIASSCSDPNHWFLNFSSAVGDPVKHGELAESRWIAVGAHSEGVVGRFVKGVNPMMREEYRWGAKKRCGVLAMDFPELPKESDLVARVVGTNM